MDWTWVGALSWGTLPDWLSAVGTVGAVIVALRVSLRDGKRLSEEREEAARDRQLFREQQAAQAEALKRQLAAKVSLVTEKVFVDADTEGIHWRVHNGSEEPISVVSIVQRRSKNNPSDTPLPPVEIAKTWPLIEPGGSREWTSEIRETGFDPEREVQFRDGMGNVWQRTVWGRLRPIEPDDPEALEMVLLPAF